eukprot:CAMPEP_0182491624 /NCGR_PEP_ID=MMETSP1321-20130603/978_1 /TAXON_ID=91990 /ORGANISM="Bolidomonas sp., Strain RCC1657" /LENGTH=240 /DNA_ID=CAMNT_0024693911 /DNA_START=21 /DNA_END=743 /DNA_ORIENTATION=+
MKFLLLLSILSSASAFLPPTLPPSPTLLHSDAAIEEVPSDPSPPSSPSYTCISKSEIMSEPNCLEFGSVWDPLNLSSLGSSETLAWFRHAEVKHGRVAMAAFTGWAAVGAGLHLPGDLTRSGLHFADIPKAGLAAWDAVPGIGKVQMLIFAGLVEFHDEIFQAKGFQGKESKHYLRGGTPGRNAVPGLYDPFGLSSRRSEKELARGRAVEIKNGRLAMIGFMGLYAAAMIDGSVPFQPTP